jgi:basic membrane lipoprotein Med (substrate-binding protein (PBP1-ABC) superfamily)
MKAIRRRAVPRLLTTLLASVAVLAAACGDTGPAEDAQARSDAAAASSEASAASAEASAASAAAGESRAAADAAAAAAAEAQAIAEAAQAAADLAQATAEGNAADVAAAEAALAAAEAAVADAQSTAEAAQAALGAAQADAAAAQEALSEAVAAEPEPPPPPPEPAPAPAEAAEPYRVVILFPGFSNDESWANAWWDGALKAMEDYPNVHVEPTEYAYEVDDYLQQGLSYASEGFDLVLMAHGAMADPAAQVAEAYPDVQVCVAPVDPTPELLDGSPENLCFIDMAQHHANFFTGVLAALITETGHVGALGGFPFPALTRQPETFHLGARCVNPDIEFTQEYVMTWDDTGLAKTAAQALIAGGVDVIQSATDQAVLGIIDAAQEADSQVWVIPAYYDSHHLAPEVILSSSVHGLADVAYAMIGRGYIGEVEKFNDFTAYNTPGIAAAPVRDPALSALTAEDIAIYEDFEARVRGGQIQIPDETKGDNPVGLEQGIGGKINLADIGC